MIKITNTPHLHAFIAAVDPTAMLVRLITNTRGFVYRRRHDPAWTMEFVSDGCRDVTGYDPHRFIGNHSLAFADLIAAGDRRRVAGELAAAVESRRRRTLRYRIRTAYHVIVWVEDRLTPVYDADGRITAIEGVIDLSKPDWDLADAHSAWEEAFAEAFLRHPMPLVLSRPDGTVCAMNEACVRRFDLSVEDILDANYRLDDLLRRLGAGPASSGGFHAPDAAAVLGAVSLPATTPIGGDTILTVFPRRCPVRSRRRRTRPRRAHAFSLSAFRRKGGARSPHRA